MLPSVLGHLFLVGGSLLPTFLWEVAGCLYHLHREIATQHLAQVAAGCQVVVHAAIAHQEHFATRDLAVDDTSDVAPGRRHQIAAEFQHQVRVREIGRRARHQLVQGCANRRKFERLLTRVVRHAKAAAQIQHTNRRRCVRSQGYGTGIAVFQQGHHGGRVQHLRTGIEMKTRELHRERRH